MQALPIPETSPSHYISFKHALNIRYPDEDTGEWHFTSAFFGNPQQCRTIPLAGEKEVVDTNPSLKDLGIREMSDVLKAQKVLMVARPVYVANHYRAIADLAMMQLNKNKIPSIATPRAINQWLDTEEQVNLLVEKYLAPLRTQLQSENLDLFEQWIKTVQFD